MYCIHSFIPISIVIIHMWDFHRFHHHYHLMSERSKIWTKSILLCCMYVFFISFCWSVIIIIISIFIYGSLHFVVEMNKWKNNNNFTCHHHWINAARKIKEKEKKMATKKPNDDDDVWVCVRQKLISLKRPNRFFSSWKNVL